MYTENEVSAILNAPLGPPLQRRWDKNVGVLDRPAGYLHGACGVFQVQAIATGRRTEVAPGRVVFTEFGNGFSLAIRQTTVPNRFQWGNASTISSSRDVADYVRATGASPNHLPPQFPPEGDVNLVRAYLDRRIESIERVSPAVVPTRAYLLQTAARAKELPLGDDLMYECLNLGLASQCVVLASIGMWDTNATYPGRWKAGQSWMTVSPEHLRGMWPGGVATNTTMYGYLVPPWYLEIVERVVQAGGPLLVPTWYSLNSCYQVNQQWCTPCLGGSETGGQVAWTLENARATVWWRKPVSGAVQYASLEACGSSNEWPYTVPDGWRSKFEAVAHGLANAEPRNWTPEVVCYALRNVPILVCKRDNLEAYRIKVASDAHGVLMGAKILPCEHDGTLKPVDPDLDAFGRSKSVPLPTPEPEDSPAICAYCEAEYDAENEGLTCDGCGDGVCGNCYTGCTGCDRCYCDACRDGEPGWNCAHCEQWYCTNCEPDTDWFEPDSDDEGLRFCRRLCAVRYMQEEVRDLPVQERVGEPEWRDLPPPVTAPTPPLVDAVITGIEVYPFPDREAYLVAVDAGRADASDTPQYPGHTRCEICSPEIAYHD